MLSARLLLRGARPSASRQFVLGRAMTMSSDEPIRFGPFEVTKQVFLTTPHSFGLVNLKPLIPGHVLVCPRAARARLTDLNPSETADLFATVQLTQRLLARIYFSHDGARRASSSSAREGYDDDSRPAGSFTVAVQDGPEAGQTVPHVHVHVIPRTRGDMGDGAASDDVYMRLAAEAGNVGGALWDREKRPVPGGGMPRIEDDDRAVRTPEQMHDEAARYRATLREMSVKQ